MSDWDSANFIRKCLLLKKISKSPLLLAISVYDRVAPTVPELPLVRPSIFPSPTKRSAALVTHLAVSLLLPTNPVVSPSPVTVPQRAPAPPEAISAISILHLLLPQLPVCLPIIARSPSTSSFTIHILEDADELESERRLHQQNSLAFFSLFLQMVLETYVCLALPPPAPLPILLRLPANIDSGFGFMMLVFF